MLEENSKCKSDIFPTHSSLHEMLFDPCQCCLSLKRLCIIFHGLFFFDVLFPIEKGMGCF